MKAAYRITENDYVDIMKLAARPSSRQAVIYLVAALLLILLAVFGPMRVKFAAIGGLIGALIFTVAGHYIVQPIIWRRHYRKYKLIQEEMAVELLEEGIRFKTPDVDGRLTWDKILKWRQNEKYFLIYQAPRVIQIIPKKINSEGFDVSLLTNKLINHLGNPS